MRIPTKKCNSFNFALLQRLLLPINFYFGHCTGRGARHILFAFRDRICVTRIGGTGDLCHSSFNVSSSLNSSAEEAWSSFIIVWKILCCFPGFVMDALLYQSCVFFNIVQNAFESPLHPLSFRTMLKKNCKISILGPPLLWSVVYRGLDRGHKSFVRCKTKW